MHTPLRGVLFDVDGTLVDSNDANAHAWVDAMGMEGHEVAFDTVRPLIGMGADKVLPQVLGIAKETEEGQRISQHRKDIYKQQYMPNLNAFPGALELLERMRRQGLKLIIATTAEPEELQGVLPLLGPNASTLFADAATAKEAGQSKPDGDVVQVAIERSGYSPEELVMIGDTPIGVKIRKDELRMRNVQTPSTSGFSDSMNSFTWSCDARGGWSQWNRVNALVRPFHRYLILP